METRTTTLLWNHVITLLVLPPQFFVYFPKSLSPLVKLGPMFPKLGPVFPPTGAAQQPHEDSALHQPSLHPLHCPQRDQVSWYDSHTKYISFPKYWKFQWAILLLTRECRSCSIPGNRVSPACYLFPSSLYSHAAPSFFGNSSPSLFHLDYYVPPLYSPNISYCFSMHQKMSFSKYKSKSHKETSFFCCHIL